MAWLEFVIRDFGTFPTIIACFFRKQVFIQIKILKKKLEERDIKNKIIV